ncbi:MAG: penicillin acylase family protein [Halocynthiibacter sp.]
MARAFKWIIRSIMAIAALVMVILLFAYYLAQGSLPDYTDNRELDVTEKVEIVRDTAGVPHIFATQDHDAYFALGYAHAQDRLWQMMMMRRTAQGRLSELFGNRTLPIDKLLRRLDLYGLAAQSVAAQSDEAKSALDAYADGVNAWLTTVNKSPKGRGAPEFFFFAPEIAPWQPTDSLAVIKLMALQLTSHVQKEVLYAQTALLLEDARLEDLYPSETGSALTTPNRARISLGTLFPDLKTAQYQPRNDDLLSPVKRPAFSGASNAWAASNERSANGGTLLANDPHLGFTAPSIWYLARLQLKSGGVIGATIPGLPVILTGRSDAIGWGLTSSYLDDQDLFIEKLNPDNPKEYLGLGGYKTFKTRSSVINVKDEKPVSITLRWTENGPVLPADQYNIGSITPDGHVMSLSWTALSGADTSYTAALNLMQAKSVAGALSSLGGYIAPSQNLTIVDKDNIALTTIGAVPKRDLLHQSLGRMPSPGWLSNNRWNGMFPYAQNPRFVNPEGGIVGNTNNKVIDAPFPNHISYIWGDTQRVQRWKKLMNSRMVHTRESFIDTQLDEVSFTARTLLPLVGKDLWYTQDAAPKGSQERQRKRALDLLAAWNGEMNEHLPEPLIYAAWLRAIQKRVLQDELGPLTAEYNHLQPYFLEKVFRNIDGAGIWCDVVQSTPVETCAQIASSALDDALLWIDERYGQALESLRWGDAHQAIHKHPVLGNIPVLEWVVNIVQPTSGGDNTLLRGRTRGEGPDPFMNVHGAGYRGVYDFEDPDSSVFVISTGQSGHPLSRFYDNLGEFWRRGEYIPMSLDPELAYAANAGITTILPKTGD